jgi:hypothetical protein
MLKDILIVLAALVIMLVLIFACSIIEAWLLFISEDHDHLQD